MTTRSTVRSDTAPTRTGLGLFSRNGIVPNVVQIVAPLAYDINERHEESLEGGSSTPLGYPDDPNYPSDSRADPLAWTPIYRGHQNPVFDVQLDPYVYHGVGSESAYYTDGTWYEWDGVTTFSVWCPDTYTDAQKIQHRKDWYDFVFPGLSTGNFCIRGLKQLYEANNPFADPYHPTVREWEIWNDKVLNHFRVLSGLSPAIPLQELYIMCAWTKERKTTDLWYTEYPGVLDSAYGPCIGGTNIHCGSSFKPSVLEEQSPYWNEFFVKYPRVVRPPAITLVSASEAVTVWYNGTAMTAMSRNLRKIFEGCGTNGDQIAGHGGPYAFRQYYGLAIGRSKWAGILETPPAGYTY